MYIIIPRKLILFLVYICGIGIFSMEYVLAQENAEQIIEEGLSADIDLNFRIKTGNVDVMDTGSNFRFEYKNRKNLTFFVWNMQYAIKENNKFMNRGFAHIRYNRITKKVIWEFYVQQSFNEFIRLTSRTLAGVGGKFILWEGEKPIIHFGSSYMVEREHIDISSGSIEKPITVNQRLSNYLAFNWNPSNRVDLVNSIDFQPRIDRFSDIRILNTFVLKMGFTSRLSTKMIITFGYDSNPPDKIGRSDFEISNTLGVSF